jgi:hypothetical protein
LRDNRFFAGVAVELLTPMESNAHTQRKGWSMTSEKPKKSWDGVVSLGLFALGLLLFLCVTTPYLSRLICWSFNYFAVSVFILVGSGIGLVKGLKGIADRPPWAAAATVGLLMNSVLFVLALILVLAIGFSPNNRW